MNRHEVENILARLNLGWKLFKSSEDITILEDLRNTIKRLEEQFELEEKLRDA